MDMNTIDFEAHFITEDLRNGFAGRIEYPYMSREDNVMHFGDDCALPYGALMERLSDLSDRRIALMDEAGIQRQVLSCVGGCELLPAAQGTAIAHASNDMLHNAIAQHSDRFLGYCILGAHDVEASVAELERCVKDFGFIGWNAFSNFGDSALDDPQYFPLLKKAAELNACIYLHPTMPTMDRLHGLGRQLVASGLGFGTDVTITFMRMALRGVFDELPNLKVILGHLGEGIPYIMDRMRLRGKPEGAPSAVNIKSVREYVARNMFVTTSGNYSSAAFQCAKEALGVDHILLGSDFPMEPMIDCTRFIDSLPLTQAERNAILWQNGAGLFRI